MLEASLTELSASQLIENAISLLTSIYLFALAARVWNREAAEDIKLLQTLHPGHPANSEMQRLKRRTKSMMMELWPYVIGASVLLIFVHLILPQRLDRMRPLEGMF
ncbi:hypothetical protein [Aminobacter sp. MET-1]|uniref:hypothetical protein n=1 Tax=Aminobacter sp. MET-1 TaxID=2951085 RepID=UPI00226A308E|nr:hypothetical protein [Aminobacter sp. MET-1]MCX8568709.1 hypothetical protein [Aminobacter sp. MET-1]